jgi:hypothetical protein
MPSAVTLVVALVFFQLCVRGVLGVLTMTHPSGRRLSLHSMPSMIAVNGAWGGGRRTAYLIAVAGMRVMRVRR